MQIRPLGNRILVRPLIEDEMVGGIVLPATADKEKKQQGEIVAVGEGEDIQKLNLKAGDKVVYGRYAGEEISLERQDYKILGHEDVLAVIE